MSKMKRTLLISCAVILLCMTIVVGMTYALFTDNVLVKHHLKAGNLNIELWRTNLDYSVLNPDSGYMDNVNDPADVNFTSATNENVFGFKAEERFFEDCLAKIKKESLTNDLKELNTIFSQETDLEKRKQIVKMIAELTAKLSKY